MPIYDRIGGFGGKSSSLPSFRPAEYDYTGLRKMAGGIAQPQTSRLRRQLRLALTGQFDNPATRAMQTRQALSGFGEGLASINLGSRQAAMSALAPEFGARTQASLIDYQTRLAEYLKEKRRKEMEAAQPKVFKPAGGFAAPEVMRTTNFNVLAPYGSSFTGTTSGGGYAPESTTAEPSQSIDQLVLRELYGGGGDLEGAGLGEAFSRLREGGDRTALLEDYYG